MAQPFEVTCGNCGHQVPFQIADVEHLESHIDAEVEEARDEGREECTDDDSVLDTNEIMASRIMLELSAAIRRDDRREAELLLDRLAAEMGGTIEEQVALGRFTYAPVG